MRRPVHFEIYAEKPERAAKFYSELFGWRVQKWDGPVDYWLLMTGTEGEEAPGIDGAVVTRPTANPDVAEPTPVIGYVCTVDVEDIDAAIAKAKELGGTEAHRKMPVPGVGWQIYYKDTEGNIFGMMQADPEAK